MTPLRNSLAGGVAGGLLFALRSSAASATNSAVQLLGSPSLPETGPSLLRVVGALALVAGIFLGAVWLFRNGRRFALHRGGAPRLRVVESHFLGGRQALYVVGYEQERFLLASTPTGINLLSNLPPAPAESCEPKPQSAGHPSFSEALALVLKGQSPIPSKRGGAK